MLLFKATAFLFIYGRALQTPAFGLDPGFGEKKTPLPVSSNYHSVTSPPSHTCAQGCSGLPRLPAAQPSISLGNIQNCPECSYAQRGWEIMQWNGNRHLECGGLFWDAETAETLLEKTLESPLDCKEIKSGNPIGGQA